MSGLDILLKPKTNNREVFKDNWNGLYPKENRFTYPEATLIMSKKQIKKSK